MRFQLGHLLRLGRIGFSDPGVLLARSLASGGGAGGSERALEAALRQIESTHGSGAVMKLGDRPASDEELGVGSVISTGSISLDAALGIGGMARGRVVEVYGPESSGKTTIALHVIAEAQKNGGKALFIDAEHALDLKYAAGLGVDTAELLLSQPDCGEQALEIADTLIRSHSIDVVVVDSVAALVPKAELEGDMGDPHMALQARLMSQALRKLSHSLSRSNAVLLFLNQVRTKLSIGGWGMPGEITAGGKALKYYASMRLDVRRTGAVKKGDETIGDNIRIKIAKNKLAPPLREVHAELVYGKGMCKLGELLDLGMQYGFIKRAGSWFSMGETKLGQGRDKAKAWFEENPEAMEELRQQIREKVAMKHGTNATAETVATEASG